MGRSKRRQELVSLIDTIPSQFAYVLLLKQLCDTVHIMGRMYPDR